MMAPAKSFEMSMTFSRLCKPTPSKRRKAAVCATLFVTATHSSLPASTSFLICAWASAEKYPCVATAKIRAVGANSRRATQTLAMLPQVSNMSSTMMMASMFSASVSAMILISPTPPTFLRNLSTIMKPTRSSSAMRRVNFRPPPSVAQTTRRSWLKPGTLHRMKSARYLSEQSSSSTVPTGEKPASAWLCRSTTKKRSAPAVFMHLSSSFGGIASPATSRRSCRA
mmetsp:Transcript_11240/g.35694  ORF Transcript_11240/g.35694 Transcript_11240/m.35694 type:complete len:226 (+) Transcript_11240:218-895(+)